MTDWATISSLATAGGTLVLAVATFTSVRSANRVARTAERALQVGLRPVLVTSRLQDPPEKMLWGDRRWTTVAGGHAAVEEADGNIYFALSLRNVGTGIAVLAGWHVDTGFLRGRLDYPDLSAFRPQMRDLMVPAGDVSFWQGAVRDSADEVYEDLRHAIAVPDPITIHLLYSDHEVGQRTISRFSLVPGDEGEWLGSVSRHWNLDRQDIH
jgi:hypothetical protein